MVKVPFAVQPSNKNDVLTPVAAVTTAPIGVTAPCMWSHINAQTLTYSHTPCMQAMDYFATLIGKNVYALFFFAGHGFELNNLNYMMAVDASMNKNPMHCLCAQHVLHTMQARGAKLSIVLLDMCRVRAPSP